jgi:hypothetical protein
MDFIGEIHPSSSKGHRFILVAMDYFMKWTKAVPLKNMTQGSDKFCPGAHCSSVWDASNVDDRSGCCSYVTSI